MKGRKAKEKPSDAELMAFAEKHNHSNLIKGVKIEFHVGEPTARKWLEEAGLIKAKQAKTESEPIHCGTCKRRQKDCSTYCRIEGRYTDYEPQTPPTQEKPEEDILCKCADCGKGLKYAEGYLTITGKTLCKECNSKSLVKQTPKPEGAQPDPAQSEVSAKAIITDEEIKETLDKCEVCGEESYPEGPQLNKFITADGKEVCYTCYLESEYSYLESEYSDKPSYTPADNDYSDEPQRTTLTNHQYDAMLNDTEERQTALQIYLENQSCESLLKRWAGEVFEHSGLSRERKLELIGQLLDWGTGA